MFQLIGDDIGARADRLPARGILVGAFASDLVRQEAFTVLEGR